MSLLLKLTVLNIKNMFGLSVIRDRIRKRDKLWQPIFATIAILYSFGVLAFMFSKLAGSIVTTGLHFGQPELVFTVAIVAIQLIVLVMGLFLVISTFYFSSDLSILVPMPLKPSYIFMGKLATVVINEYLTAALFFVPTVIAFNRYINGGLNYWLSTLVVFLLLPLLPLTISSIMALGLMKVINRRHRDTLMVIGSLLIVALSLGINFFISGQVGDDPEALSQLLASRYGLIETIGKRFPGAIWGTKAIGEAGTGVGFLNLGLFVALAVIAVLVLMAIAEKLFFAGLIGGDEVTRKSKTLSGGEWEAKTRTGDVFQALFKREWRIFLRTPIFAMNGFLGALIMPLAMVMPLLMQADMMEQFLGAVSVEPWSTALSLGVAGMIILLGSMNTMASTSISREGKLFYISKMIPVPAKMQAQAKLAHAFVGTLVSSLPIALFYLIMVKPGFIDLLAALLIGLAGSLLGLATGLYIDMLWPKLNWTAPQQAVKQNLNAVLPMFLEMLILAGSGFMAFRLLDAGLSRFLVYFIFFSIYAASSLLVYKLTLDAAEKRYHALDV